MKKRIIATLLTTSSLFANESALSEIALNLDDGGNINPSISIPIYYGKNNKFFSSLEYTSSNMSEVDVLDGFIDSKNAFVSRSNELTLNYISYSTKLSSLQLSFGINSTFASIKNNEFGYIHDSENVFNKGDDYYISYDNEVLLDIVRYSLSADVVFSFSKKIDSRLHLNISPFSTLDVDQSTIFKPLVSQKGESSSSYTQDISYNIRYDIQYNTDSFFDIGLTLKHKSNSFKYDVAALNADGSNFSFTNQAVDTTETTTSYMLKTIFKYSVLGGLKPSLGFGMRDFSKEDNINNSSVDSSSTIFSFSFERDF